MRILGVMILLTLLTLLTSMAHAQPRPLPHPQIPISRKNMAINPVINGSQKTRSMSANPSVNGTDVRPKH